MVEPTPELRPPVSLFSDDEVAMRDAVASFAQEVGYCRYHRRGAASGDGGVVRARGGQAGYSYPEPSNPCSRLVLYENNF